MHVLSYIHNCFVTKNYYYTGTQDSSKTNVDQSLGVIIGSVVGVLMIAAAATTVGVLAILCFIKGTSEMTL